MKSFLMPSLLVALIVTTLIVISCNKNNSGKPSLSLESISTTIQIHDSMRARFKFTEGKLVSNGNLSWIRSRLNQDPPSYPSGQDTFGYQLPTFSANSGEIYLSLPWDGYLSTGSPENDTLIFRFFLTNAADSAISDTINSPKIVVLYQ